MFCGFDFGTSHCAVGIQQENNTQLIALEDQSPFMPSMLYSFDRGLITDFNHQLLIKSPSPELASKYLAQRTTAADRVFQLKRQHDLSPNERHTFVGTEAINEYIEFPEEGFFIKSPKSFLGANGLQSNQLEFFEDISTALMLAVKSKAEAQIQTSLTKAVIGRPVNFQGLDSEKSNQQAIDILTRSAKLAGFKQVEFLYEPLAAGIDFETNLTTEKLVLVIDIGGGTTDCSIVKMGPNKNQLDRKEDFLAHTGKRVGGNDLDVYNAFYNFMPLLGANGNFKSGSKLPRTFFWNAVATNNVSAQNDFVANSNKIALEQLCRDAEHPKQIQRLLKLQKDKLNHRLVREAELTKINLSSSPSVTTKLDFIETALSQQITIEDFAKSIESPVQSMNSLIIEALQQAQAKPDLVYITGGSAKSEVIQRAVKQVVFKQCGEQLEFIDGDYFGSVTAGLTKWASSIFN